MFTDNFEGFDYNVGDKKYRFKVKNAAEIKEGQTVTLNVGGGGRLTLDAKKADDDLTGGPLRKYKKGY